MSRPTVVLPDEPTTQLPDLELSSVLYFFGGVAAVVAAAVVALALWSRFTRARSVTLVVKPPAVAPGTPECDHNLLYFPGEALVVDVLSTAHRKGDALALVARARPGQDGEPAPAARPPARPLSSAPSEQGNDGNTPLQRVVVPSASCTVTLKALPAPGAYDLLYVSAGDGVVVKTVPIHVARPIVACVPPAAAPLYWASPIVVQYHTSTTHNSYDKVVLLRCGSASGSSPDGGGGSAGGRSRASSGTAPRRERVAEAYVPKWSGNGRLEFPKGAPSAGYGVCGGGGHASVCGFLCRHRCSKKRLGC